MRTTILAAAALVGIASIGGCNRQGGSPGQAGAVAVIDLDLIAQRLGSDKQMAQAINQRQTTLSQQLTELAKSYNQQIAEKKKTLEQQPPEENQVTLASWEQEANRSLNKVKLQAERDLQQHRANLVRQFREEVKPVARRVAQARGLSVIVTKNDSVLYDFAPAADITEAVLAELQTTHTAAAAPPQASQTR